MLKSRQMSEVRTRFAPSPTGFLHIGGLRTALYSYAFAKSQGGKFVLRIEDTDRRRFIPGATEKAYEALKTFGISWDEGPLVNGPYSPYIQSERVATGIYQKYAEKLLANGHAYYCFCEIKTKEEVQEEHRQGVIKFRDENCRNLTPKEIEEKIKSGKKSAIRLKVPDSERIGYFDFIREKEISWNTKNIDEVMLLKSDGFPTYHLAAVVDDAVMKISHILRAHEWLPSTPVHLLLFRYLDFPLPKIGHYTVILDPEGGKLSKRKGSVSCEEFLAEGYLPEAILNFIMLLGWAPKDNRELFTLQEFVDNFQKGTLQVTNPVFNRRKLDWFNGYYIRKKSDEELFLLFKRYAPEGLSEAIVRKTIPLVKERSYKLSDYPITVSFLAEEPRADINLLLQKGKDRDLIRDQLIRSIEEINGIKDWKAEALENSLRELATKNNWHTGQYFMSLRIAVTGKTVTPPLFASMEILGKSKTLQRLKKTVKVLK